MGLWETSLVVLDSSFCKRSPDESDFINEKIWWLDESFKMISKFRVNISREKKCKRINRNECPHK